MTRPAAGAQSRVTRNRAWRAVGRGLAAGTVRSLEGMLPWLVAAGVSALTRPAWRAVLAAVRPAVPAPAEGGLPPARKALPLPNRPPSG